MPKGGIKSTTWPKGQKPPVHRPKGSKNKKTVLREAMGLKDWEGFEEYCKTEGATKLVQELQALKGVDFVTAMKALLEFTQPKKTRVTHVGVPEDPLHSVLKIVHVHTNVPVATSEEEITM